MNLLLLDEPTNGLDVRGLVRLRQTIQEISSTGSTTIVVVSHDADLINDVATDVIHMSGKKLWYFHGNYDSYLWAKQREEELFRKQSKAMEKKHHRLTNTLQHLKEAPMPKRKNGAKKKARAIARSRTCLLGPGGYTSCLLKILAKKIAPTEGTVHHSPGLAIGFCDGGDPRVDAIANAIAIANAPPTITVLEYLVDRFPNKTETDLRSHLAAFGLSSVASQVVGTPLACLSGGESFRFVLATVFLLDDNDDDDAAAAPPPVLFLEHPTSHLDVESVQALAHGLREWNGTLVVTSHDASFIRSLGEDVRCVVIVPEEGKIRRIVEDDRSGVQGIDVYLESFLL
eukprot:jgi/Psemu1/292441/fgenesh1_pg.1055_\